MVGAQWPIDSEKVGYNWVRAWRGGSVAPVGSSPTRPWGVFGFRDSGASPDLGSRTKGLIPGGSLPLGEDRAVCSVDGTKTSPRRMLRSTRSCGALPSIGTQLDAAGLSDK